MLAEALNTSTYTRSIAFDSRVHRLPKGDTVHFKQGASRQVEFLGPTMDGRCPK